MSVSGFHVMAKPMGPVCNLECKYCFYLEKNKLFPQGECFRMSESVLEAYIKKYICEQDIPEITFVWQGGEPTLAGIPFFQTVLRLQDRWAEGKQIHNALQTNGIMLDDTWCRFLRANDFLVGISLDGPAFLHDRNRTDCAGNGTFHRVLHAIGLLQQYGIEYNVLVSVTRESCAYGRRIYRFLRSLGVRHMQFTPVIERMPDQLAEELGLQYAVPQEPEAQCGNWQVTDFTVEPEAYGQFLTDVFDEWIEQDVGRIFIRNVEDILPVYLGLNPTMCVYEQQCGGCMIVEHNGDVYSCDHFMYPAYRLGNVQQDSLYALAHSEQQQAFGARKKELPMSCRMCEVLPVCGGGCPKHRFVCKQGETMPTHYLCAGYRMFYRHIHPYMKAMAQLISNNLPVTDVMKLKNGPLIYMQDPSVSSSGCPSMEKGNT